MLQRSFIVIALCLSNALLVLSFAPTARITKRTTFSDTSIFSSEYDGEGDGSEGTQSNPAELQVPQQVATQPAAVRKKQMDPLLASLTREDPRSTNGPMTTIPLLGEIPSDSVKVLAPIAVVGIIGFIYSIVVTLINGDELTNILMQAGNAISEKAASQPNQIYDPDVCRGICTGDQEGLKNFMESLRK